MQVRNSPILEAGKRSRESCRYTWQLHQTAYTVPKLPSSPKRRRVFGLTMLPTKWDENVAALYYALCTSTVSLARSLLGATYHHVHLHHVTTIQSTFYIARCTRAHKICRGWVSRAQVNRASISATYFSMFLK